MKLSAVASRPLHEADWISRLFSEYVVLPTQLPRSSWRTSEQRLLAAVLEDALRVLHNAVPIKNESAVKMRAETLEWLLDDAPGVPFSFDFICEHLGLDAAAIRRGLARLDFVPPKIATAHRGLVGRMATPREMA